MCLDGELNTCWLDCRDGACEVLEFWWFIALIPNLHHTVSVSSAPLYMVRHPVLVVLF